MGYLIKVRVKFMIYCDMLVIESKVNFFRSLSEGEIGLVKGWGGEEEK